MDPSDLRRLAFIKYLFSVALNQSKLPEPAGAASILTFHDAIELFNQLACEHLDIDTSSKENKQISFMGYWDLISSKLGVPLPQKESISRLNKARVALKHHGNLPSKLDIESFRANANSFFLESTPLVFKIDFQGDISLIDLIVEEHTRQHLHEATLHLSDDKVELETALQQVALAFQYLVDDYDQRKRTEYGWSRFTFGKSFSSIDRMMDGLGRISLESALGDRRLADNLSEFIDKVYKTIDAMQSTIRILALGIDYPRYSRLKMFMPIVIRQGTGEYVVQGNITENKFVSIDDVQYCIDFVIETALQMQESDYSVPER